MGRGRKHVVVVAVCPLRHVQLGVVALGCRIRPSHPVRRKKVTPRKESSARDRNRGHTAAGFRARTHVSWREGVTRRARLHQHHAPLLPGLQCSTAAHHNRALASTTAERNVEQTCQLPLPAAPPPQPQTQLQVLHGAVCTRVGAADLLTATCSFCA